MTALTVPAQPEEDASLRPVPWRRMAWVTWRQHRFALGGVAALLGALAVYLWIAGLHLHHAYAVATACHPASSVACLNTILDFNSTYSPTAETIASLLLAVPALIGAFTGAPVLARELETGTFRYAWTQGFGRWRWTLAKLVPLAIAVAAAAGAFSLLFSWYYQPFFAQTFSFNAQVPLDPGLFDLRGVAFAAWTLAAFAIGALAGMLIRRVVPAIAATLAVYAGLAFATGLFLRQHYLTPLLTSNPNVPGSAWIFSQWWTKDGKFAFAVPPTASSTSSALPFQTSPAARRRSKSSSRASPSTATRYGPATSRPAGSGHSSGSRAVGCSRCQRCSSPRPSGWSAAVPPEPPGNPRLNPPAAIVLTTAATRVTMPMSAVRRQCERPLDRRENDRDCRGLINGLRWIFGEHGDDIAVPCPGGSQVGEGQDPWLGSALEPGCLPLGRVELEAIVVERNHLADRRQARAAGEGGQGGIGTADITGRREIFKAINVAWRGPCSRRRHGRKGRPVDGAGE